MSQRSEQFHTLVNVVVVIACLVVVFQPDGVAGAFIRKARESRRDKVTARTNIETLSRAPSRIGNSRTGVVLVEFSDYQCAYCRRNHPLLRDRLKEGGDWSLVIRHMPLSGPASTSAQAAIAAICAESSGRFEPMHEVLFSAKDWDEPIDWKAHAIKAGVTDLAAFEACMNSDAPRARLREDMQLAQKLQLGGTPAFIHSNGIHRGLLPLEKLDAIIGITGNRQRVP